MSEITKEPVEQVKQAFKDRISSPLWGYVFFSWLGFNWQNIAKLFMSKREVEVRIAEITSQEWFFVHYIVLPVIVGAALAAVSPYLQQWLAAAHKNAEDKRKADTLTEEWRLIDVDMLKKEKLIELSKVAERTEQTEKEKLERQKARNESRLALIRLKEVALTKATADLEKAYEDTQVRLNKLLNETKKVEESYNSKVEALNEASDGLNKMGQLYHKYNKLATHEDFVSFLNELNKKKLFGLSQLDKDFKSMAEREIIYNEMRKNAHGNVNSDGSE